MRIALLCGVSLFLVASVGCRRTVVVREDRHDHVHDDRCGHHWDGVTWVFVRNHRHGHGCGHHFHSGGWHLHPADHKYRDSRHGHLSRAEKAEIREEIREEADCRHHDTCGHHWDGVAWVWVRGHRHGPGCGHHHHHGHWHLHPDGHRYGKAGHGHFGVHVVVGHKHDDRCGHAWDGRAWISISGHVHRAGCGHHFHSGGWHLHPAGHRYDDDRHGHLGRDVREDIRDEREDRRDEREDKRDEREDKRDEREDKRDKREDKKDKKK